MLGVKSEEAGLSRRDFLFGIAIAGAVASPHAVRAGSGSRVYAAQRLGPQSR